MLGLALALGGCERRSEPPGPEQVVAAFLREMSGMHGDPLVAERIVELLWAPARSNLAERARRASALSGRPLPPGELLVPSWFTVRGTPERFESRVAGDWAEVRIVAADGRFTTARCVREDSGWKLVLELPPLAPIRQREGVSEP
jgi:hypothetical protein